MDGFDQLIEATIVAFYFDSARKEIQIGAACVWGDKGQKKIIASGVDELMIDDMRCYNIIDRIRIVGKEDVDKESNWIARLFYLLQRRELVAADLDWPILKEKISMVRDGRLQLIEIEPVIGASIMVLAEVVRLETVV